MTLTKDQERQIENATVNGVTRGLSKLSTAAAFELFHVGEMWEIVPPDGCHTYPLTVQNVNVDRVYFFQNRSLVHREGMAYVGKPGVLEVLGFLGTTLTTVRYERMHYD